MMKWQFRAVSNHKKEKRRNKGTGKDEIWAWLAFFKFQFQGDDFVPCDPETCPLMKFHNHPELEADLVIMIIVKIMIWHKSCKKT